MRIDTESFAAATFPRFGNFEIDQSISMSLKSHRTGGKWICCGVVCRSEVELETEDPIRRTKKKKSRSEFDVYHVNEEAGAISEPWQVAHRWGQFVQSDIERFVMLKVCISWSGVKCTKCDARAH